MLTPLAGVVLAITILTAAVIPMGTSNRSESVPVARVTMISKNQPWPFKSQITIKSCRTNPCVEV